MKLALVLAVAVFAVTKMAAQALTAEEGIIQAQIVATKVQGEVEVRSGGSNNALVDGAQVKQGDVVRTGVRSSVVLFFSNGATLSLGADTELVVARFLQDPFPASVVVAQLTREPTVSIVHLQLNRGEVVANVIPLNLQRGSAWKLDSPVGGLAPGAGSDGGIFRMVLARKADPAARRFAFSLTSVKGGWGFSPTDGAAKLTKLVNPGETLAVDIEVAPKSDSGVGTKSADAVGRN